MLRFFVNFILFSCFFCLTLEAKPLKVITSIRPLEGITRAIAKDSPAINIASLIPPRASPHHIQLKPSQIIMLEQADLIIWIGGIFETALEPYIMKRKNAPQLRLLGQEKLKFQFYHAIDSFKFSSKKITHFKENNSQKPLINGAIDGHIWLSPAQGIIIAKLICDKLSLLDPAHHRLYQKNYEAFKKEMRAITQRLKKAFAHSPTVPYFIFHNAYGYFEDSFHIHPQGIFLQGATRAPSAKHLAEIEDLIREYKAACIFQEPQMNNYLLSIFKDYPQITIATLDPIGSTQQMSPHFYPELIQNLGNAYLNCFKRAKAKKEYSTCN